jgi:hypothetical protein
MPKVKIGDKVYLQGNTKIIGTVQSYYYDEYPVCVKWDNGTFDWYEISNLVLVNPPKLPRHPCE